MEVTGIEQARKNLGEIVDRARFTGEPTVISRQGKPVAVVLGIETAKAVWQLAADQLKSSHAAELVRMLENAEENRSGTQGQ